MLVLTYGCSRCGIHALPDPTHCPSCAGPTTPDQSPSLDAGAIATILFLGGLFAWFLWQVSSAGLLWLSGR